MARPPRAMGLPQQVLHNDRSTGMFSYMSYVMFTAVDGVSMGIHAIMWVVIGFDKAEAIGSPRISKLNMIRERY